MVPDAFAAHMELIRQLSKRKQALDRFATTATINNPKWWVGKEPTATRKRLHQRLISEAFDRAPGLRQERKAIVFAGPPGAGKSSLRKRLLQEQDSDYLVIDPDEFKIALLKEALADGSYEEFIKPDAIRELEAAGNKFFPMELSSLVHEESAHLARKLRDRALTNGDNIVIDSVFGGKEAARELSDALTAAGYQVQVVDLEVPFEFSEQKIRQRWIEARLAALNGEDQFGGRWVPSEYARWVFKGPEGMSRPEAVARWFAEHCPMVRGYRLYRKTMIQVDEPNAVPALEAHLMRSQPGGPLIDAKGQADLGSKPSGPEKKPAPRLAAPVVHTKPTQTTNSPSRPRIHGTPSRSGPDNSRG